MLAVLMLGSCSSEQGSEQTGAFVRASDLSSLEREFGMGVSRSEKVTLRPDVHVVEEGPAAIRSVSADALTWTLDAAATGDVALGTVLLVTSRCVGRVLAVNKTGGDVRVTLGPVQLTDIIQDADISIEQPIDFSEAITYEAPQYPGAASSIEPLEQQANESSSSADRFTPAVLPASFAQQRFIPIASGSTAASSIFRSTPILGSDGLGVRITADNGQVRMLGEARVRLQTPKLKFDLKIGGSKVVHASVKLTGAAGLLLAFQAAAAQGGVKGNINERVFIPSDFSIPIVGLGVPFAVTLRQAFVVRTVFTSPGSLNARGDYEFGGEFSMGFGGVGFEIGAPTRFSVKESLLQSTQGIAIGVTGMIFTHQAKVIVGIGAFGFATGPYFAFTSTAAVTNGSSIGIVQCRRATLAVEMQGGVGYSVPRPITNAINFILRKLNLGEISGAGGFESDPHKVVESTAAHPSVKACT